MKRLLLLAALLTAPSVASAAELPFKVTLPAGVTTTTQEGPDFTVYYFNRDGKTVAGAYYGFAPQFHPAGKGPVWQEVTCKDGAVQKRSLLLGFPESDTTFYVHAWSVAGADQHEADAILASIALPGKNEGLGGVSRLKACGA